MALSFVIATQMNKYAHSIYQHFSDSLTRFEGALLPEEMIESVGNVSTAVIGMGRVGQGAHAELQKTRKDKVVGVEENHERVASLNAEGVHCIHGDAMDRDFWEKSGLKNCDLVLISLTSHRENVAVIELAREMNYTGKIAVATRFPDEAEELEAMGCTAYYLYESVGARLCRVDSRIRSVRAACGLRFLYHTSTMQP